MTLRYGIGRGGRANPPCVYQARAGRAATGVKGVAENSLASTSASRPSGTKMGQAMNTERKPATCAP